LSIYPDSTISSLTELIAAAKRERERKKTSIKFIRRIMGSETFLEVILAILIPPVGVFLRYGCAVIIFISSSKSTFTFS
jgi:uncharacterized membrane protein